MLIHLAKPCFSCDNIHFIQSLNWSQQKYELTLVISSHVVSSLKLLVLWHVHLCYKMLVSYFPSKILIKWLNLHDEKGIPLITLLVINKCQCEALIWKFLNIDRKWWSRLGCIIRRSLYHGKRHEFWQWNRVLVFGDNFQF